MPSPYAHACSETRVLLRKARAQDGGRVVGATPSIAFSFQILRKAQREEDESDGEDDAAA